MSFAFGERKQSQQRVAIFGANINGSLIALYIHTIIVFLCGMGVSGADAGGGCCQP